MNVQEVLNINKKKKEKYKENISKLLEKIHAKILHYANLNRDSCEYQIPNIMDGLPIYDVDHVVKEVFKKLDSEGYIVTAYSDGKIEVCWNEKLVEQKVKTDAYILSHEEKKLRNITRKQKKVDDRFTFLANPKKTVPPKKSADDILNEQFEKILKEKNKEQNKYKRLLDT